MSSYQLELPPKRSPEDNDSEVIINPDWIDVGDHYETYYPGHQPDLFDTICIGPPPNFLIEPNGQLQFPFMVDFFPLP